MLKLCIECGCPKAELSHIFEPSMNMKVPPKHGSKRRPHAFNADLLNPTSSLKPARARLQRRLLCWSFAAAANQNRQYRSCSAVLCLMRSCGHQASAAIHSRQLAVPAVAAAVSHSSSHSGSLACHIRNHARSPPTSPRHLLDPGDPELVRQLRTFLLRAAQHPAGSLGIHADELTDLLQDKLAVSTQEAEGLLASASSSSSKQQLQPQQLQELEAGLTSLLQLFSQQECLRLLQSQPALLFAPLASWCEFFVGYGFSSSQIKNLISQTRGEVMTKSDLVTAGERGDGTACCCWVLQARLAWCVRAWLPAASLCSSG